MQFLNGCNDIVYLDFATLDFVDIVLAETDADKVFTANVTLTLHVVHEGLVLADYSINGLDRLVACISKQVGHLLGLQAEVLVEC